MENVAVIVVDAYFAKLRVASVEPNNYFIIKDEEIDTVKLGLDIEKDHFLKKPQIEATIQTLKNFKKICDIHNVTKTYAYALFTEANRPKNLLSFFDEVFTVTGFKFDLISDEYRNTVIYRGVLNTMDAPKGVILNVEPESIHIVHYNRRNILHQETLNFGPITLLNMFPTENYAFEAQCKEFANYIETQMKSLSWVNELEPETTIVGVGSYFVDMAKMVKKLKKHPVEIDNNYTFEAKDLQSIFDQLKALGMDKTKKIRGVNESRADVFITATQTILQIMQQFQLNNVLVSTYGIIEGVLFENIIPSVLDKPISDVLGYSLTRENAYYAAENSKHNEQVYNLCMLLFKQLRVLHKLPRGYIKILRVASYLHDAGERINYHQHAKLSFGAIMGADIYGLTHREQVLSAFVASLHQGGDIVLADWLKYKDLVTDEDLDAVRKLGVILRIAEAFDRTRSNAIVDINCDILGDSVIMKTETTQDNGFEIKKALEASKDFERFFKKKIEIL